MDFFQSLLASNLSQQAIYPYGSTLLQVRSQLRQIVPNRFRTDSEQTQNRLRDFLGRNSRKVYLAVISCMSLVSLLSTIRRDLNRFLHIFRTQMAERLGKLLDPYQTAPSFVRFPSSDAPAPAPLPLTHYLKRVHLLV